MYFETECVMAVQGHPSSLILAPIESAYATSYWSSIIVTLVVSCPVSEMLQVSNPPLFHPNFGGVPLGARQIIRVITFELTQRIRPWYVYVTDRQTDRQTDGRTDGRLTIAIPHYAR